MPCALWFSCGNHVRSNRTAIPIQEADRRGRLHFSGAKHFFPPSDTDITTFGLRVTVFANVVTARRHPKKTSAPAVIRRTVWLGRNFQIAWVNHCCLFGCTLCLAFGGLLQNATSSLWRRIRPRETASTLLAITSKITPQVVEISMVKRIILYRPVRSPLGEVANQPCRSWFLELVDAAVPRRSHQLVAGGLQAGVDLHPHRVSGVWNVDGISPSCVLAIPHSGFGLERERSVPDDREARWCRALSGRKCPALRHPSHLGRMGQAGRWGQCCGPAGGGRQAALRSVRCFEHEHVSSHRFMSWVIRE